MLHKIIEKNLWIFGEQYSDTPVLFSDKSLKNNLKSLRDEFLEYKPDDTGDNVIADISSEVRDITDLFFFNEKILTEDKSEIMVVELKRPSCRISGKELEQVAHYKHSIESLSVFPKGKSYKILLISSQISDFAKGRIGCQDPKNRFLYERSKDGNIEVWVIEWSDIINMNHRKLSYLGNVLATEDEEVEAVFERDYSDIMPKNLSNLLKE